MLFGVSEVVNQTFDSVALNVSHGSGVTIGPNGFFAEFGFGLLEGLGNGFQSLVPSNSFELPASFRPHAF